MCSVNERIEILKRETIDLRNQVKDLKEALFQQNELIISLLSKQTGILQETIEAEPKVFYGKQISEFSRCFPLKNMDDLKKFEQEINDKNEEHIITLVNALLTPKGLVKGIANILSEKLIMEINVDGYHNKKRLLNFPKTIDIIFQASRKDNDLYTSVLFLHDLRRSLRMVKNRIHKNNCQARQKLREQKEQEELRQTVEKFMVKTEEIDK